MMFLVNCSIFSWFEEEVDQDLEKEGTEMTVENGEGGILLIEETARETEMTGEIVMIEKAVMTGETGKIGRTEEKTRIKTARRGPMKTKKGRSLNPMLSELNWDLLHLNVDLFTLKILILL